MLNQSDIEKFFRDYEKALSSRNTAKMADFYADMFCFGTSQGVQAINLVDFIKVLPKRSGLFDMIGLKNTTLVAIDAQPLDSSYSLAKVAWKFHYEKTGKDPIDDLGQATYIIMNQSGIHKIVFQIDHQDLLSRAKELGLYEQDKN